MLIAHMVMCSRGGPEQADAQGAGAVQDQGPVQGAYDQGVQLRPLLLPLQARRQVDTQTLS